jgi:adenylyltransferase/sulfurtransferase
VRDDQIRRYARHVLLPDVGGKGQEKILRATVRVEQASGAGEGAILYLAAAGVGTIVIEDRRAVDRAGLLYEAEDLGKSRLEAARARVSAMNPDVRVAESGDGGVRVIVEAASDPASQLEAGARAARRALEEILA